MGAVIVLELLVPVINLKSKKDWCRIIRLTREHLRPIDCIGEFNQSKLQCNTSTCRDFKIIGVPQGAGFAPIDRRAYNYPNWLNFIV